MPVDLDEFKKRFGKKPVEAEKAEERFRREMQGFDKKLKAAVGRGEKLAIDFDAEIKKLVKNKDWHGAADAIEEARPKLSVDDKRAATLRAALDMQAKRAFHNDKLAESLGGAHAGVEARIVADDYDGAQNDLDDFKALVDDHLQQVALFQSRAAEMAAKAQQVTVRVLANAAASQELKVEARQFAASCEGFVAMADSRDLVGAAKTWQTLVPTANKLMDVKLDDSPDALEKLYQSRRAAATKTLEDHWLKLLGDAEPLFAPYQNTLAQVKADAEAAATHAKDKRYKEALDSLDAALGGTGLLMPAMKAQYEKLKAAIPFGISVAAAIRQNKLPATIPSNVDPKAVQSAYVDMKLAENDQNWVLAIRMFKDCEPGLKLIWKEMEADQATKQTQESPKATEYKKLVADQKANPDRAKLLAALNDPAADHAAFRANPEATALLDKMVKDIGTNANSPDKRDFVKAAMKVRFGLTEIGGGAGDEGMSSKALPRMYSLFKKLPAKHTTDNEYIDKVERVKAKDTSTHSSTEKKIVLKAGTTDSKGGRFDDTTLHEIGHGVDTKFGFMASNAKARQYGGWHDETLETVKKVAADDLGFFKDFESKNPPVPRELLQKYIDLVFAGGDPQTLQAQFKGAKDPNVVSADKLKQHPAVMHAAAGKDKTKNDDDLKRDLTIAARKLINDAEPVRSMVSSLVEKIAFGKSVTDAVKELLATLDFTGNTPSDEDWAAMALHPAIDFASNVRLTNGSSGLWDQGDSAAKRCAVNGRVYQEAYTNDWVSYQLAARGSKVCNYQFRHRMEWFAECYSRFFLKTLDKSHPLYALLEAQK